MQKTPHLLIISAIADRTERCLFKGLSQKSGFKVDLLVDPAEPNKEDLRSATHDLREMHILHRFDIARVLQLRKQIISNNYDVIFTTYNKGLAAAMLATHGLNTKVVVYRGTMGNLSRLDPACWITHLHPRLRMIVCNCEGVKNYLLNFGLPQNKLVTIYKGHKTEWYQGTTKPTLGDLKIPNDAFIVGCVANVRELKGIDIIIKAFAKLSHLPIHLIIVGKNNDQRYPDLAQKLGIASKIHFIGFRPDAVEVTRLFNLSVMASTRREGVPRSIVESMSQGIPAVVTDIGGLPELVQHQKNGLVVPPKDPTALAEAISDLYNDRQKLQTFTVNSIKWIEERFNADKALAAYTDLFQRLTEEKNDKTHR
ncbi:MAG: glycosyltransferase family 4 protein [Bdellovibrionota bacterium]|jgi:glycosyltransferase involved in cell wall biosynthesis